MKLTESLRQELKIPLGKLILEQDTSKENIIKNIPTDSYVISVGDATTEKMIGFGLNPAMQIVDGVEKRTKRKAPTDERIMTHLTCTNPAGELTKDNISLIKDAFDLIPPVRIMVLGEEDLFVLPVCIFAPVNSVVLYGQPNEGLVIVQITPEIRNKTKKILDSMS